MKDIDRMIREALREEDAALYDSVAGEQAIHQTVLDVFRSRSRWLMLFTMIITLGLMALTVFTAIRFFGTPVVADKLFWGFACVISAMAVTAFKIWFWMEMAKNDVMREVKRLELQVAHMTGRIKNDDPA